MRPKVGVLVTLGSNVVLKIFLNLRFELLWMAMVMRLMGRSPILLVYRLCIGLWLRCRMMMVSKHRFLLGAICWVRVLLTIGLGLVSVSLLVVLPRLIMRGLTLSLPRTIGRLMIV